MSYYICSILCIILLIMLVLTFDLGGQMDRRTYSQHFLEFGSYRSFCYLDMRRRCINCKIFLFDRTVIPWINMKKRLESFKTIF